MEGFSTPLSEKMREDLVRADQEEYGERYDRIRWLNPADAAAAEERRKDLLTALMGTVGFGYKGTKLDCRNLAPGCRICGEGAWSCLFINGKCPCGCFYCPTEQSRIDVPTTQTIPFQRPADYVRYLEKFNFKGASISGGEPFLTLPPALKFISAVKKHFGEGFHVWLYTSGRFIDDENVKRLRDAGLDEIRFNIGTTGFQLNAARKAVGVIPHVTVEIPAIPEAEDRLKTAISEMAGCGITHLNLHQLRLTPYNFEHLVKRDYTFLHGEKVTVLESELTALELIRHSIEKGIDLPINYCSFAYKHRFQMAAFYRRYAALAKKPYEDITETGHIRDLWIEGPAHALGQQAEMYRNLGHPEASRLLSSARDRLHIGEGLWPDTDFEKFKVFTAHSTAKIASAVSYRNPFVEVALSRQKQVYVEKMRSRGNMEIRAGLMDVIASSGPAGNEGPEILSAWEQVREFEVIRPGLQRYF